MKLSIVISERNDPFGTLVTIRSILEELKNCIFKTEIIIVDNSDKEEMRKVLTDIILPFLMDGSVKVFNQKFPCLFSARDLGVAKSTGEYILIIDSHCLIMKDSIKNMVEFADKTDNLGMLFGLMCYSVAHESDAFCDRDVSKFTGIRLNQYEGKGNSFKIPLRSMPMMIKRSIWDEIRGYYPLSTYKLIWGGGDFLISFKPLLLGYDNWILEGEPKDKKEFLGKEYNRYYY